MAPTAVYNFQPALEPFERMISTALILFGLGTAELEIFAMIWESFHFKYL